MSPNAGCGVWGDCERDMGFTPPAVPDNGLFGSSKGDDGIHGETTSQTHAGVSGLNNSAFPCTAILGSSNAGHGVKGINGAGSGTPANLPGCGVFGDLFNGYGVYGASINSHGVKGINKGISGVGSGKSPKAGCGVWGDSDEGYGVYGSSKTGTAGAFDGDVSVTGNVTANDVILSGADCAEEFDIANACQLEPGTVVVFDDEGALSTSDKPYNKRVAGVVSGAGAYRPGVILDRRISDRKQAPVALVGKVYCKVDASYAPIEVGDFLTTSPTGGHAMKVTNASQAFGAVIGKALAPHAEGQGLIPILVSLQ